MGKPKATMFSTMNLTNSNMDSSNRKVATTDISNNSASSNSNVKSNCIFDDVSSTLQRGSLHLLLQKHDVAERSTNTINSAPSAVSSTASGGSTLRSRSNTILSDCASDIRGRSNTMGSDLDLDFVHYALDTWGLVASAQDSNNATTNPSQHQQPHGIVSSSKAIHNSSILTSTTQISKSTTITATTPLETNQSSTTNKSAAIPIKFCAKQQEQQGQLKKTSNSSNSLQQLVPVLSSSCEESVSGFLCSSNSGLINHTPPPRGSSYEASHFGKRMRSGSISGRLRSASDLVDLGIIDRNQRNMLKDLIISNSRADEELQIVLDQYEKTGDTSGLQRLISEGRLLQQKDTFDLLDDLDLDFLNVGIDGSADQNDEEFERLVDAGTPGLIASTNYRHGVAADDGVGELELFDGDNFGESTTTIAIADFPALPRLSRNKMVAAAGSLTSLRNSASSSRGFADKRQNNNAGAVAPDVFPKPAPAPPDDGIGDIDFNGFNVEDEVVQTLSHKTLRCTKLSSSLPLEELQRRRADSIQMFSSLLGGLPSDNGFAQETYGEWTNETNAVKVEKDEWGSDDESEGSSAETSEAEEDDDNVAPNKIKLKRGRKKSEVTIQKEREAEQRRRERIQRRAEKERAKQERKMQKERERQEREEKEERLREEKRFLKEAAALAKLEKQMEIGQRKAEKLKEKMEKEREKEEKKLKKEAEIKAKEKVVELPPPIKEKIISPAPVKAKTSPPPIKAKTSPPPIKAKNSPPPIKVKSSKEREKEERLKEKERREEARREEARIEEAAELARKETPSGLGLPRSMSDPNISYRNDEFGLLSVDAPEGWVGAYSPESRKLRIDRFLAKRNHRVWTKTVKYDVRKNFADSRLRVKGRFVKKEDEQLMRDLISLT